MSLLSPPKVVRTNPKRLFRPCENPACPISPKVWRAWLEQTEGILIDGRWHCSPKCSESALVTLFGQLIPEAKPVQVKSHRIPLGLLMLSRGLVKEEDLKAALTAQRNSGSGRVGEWLRHLGAATELQVTRALGMQWSLPLFPLEKMPLPLACADLVPLAILDAAQMVPVHFAPQAGHLYIAFADRVNYTFLYAVEKILNCRTEPCLALQTEIHKALDAIRQAPRPNEVCRDALFKPREMARTTMSYALRLSAQEVETVVCGEFIWARVRAAGEAEAEAEGEEAVEEAWTNGDVVVEETASQHFTGSPASRTNGSGEPSRVFG